MPRSQARRGLSLLEVLTALAIFLGALIGIGQLVIMSGERALDVQQQTQAAQLCQAKLAEVIAGVVPMSASGDSTFDEDPDWHWSLDAQQDTVSGLWDVTVRVTRQRPDGRKIEVALSQMVLDPSLRGSTLDIAAAAAANSSNSSSSSSSTGSSSSSSSTPSSSGTGKSAAGSGGASKGGS
jgi:hypothetical protein